MAAQRTLGQLKTSVRQRADQENSNFISDSELTSYINQSHSALYDLLVTAYGNDYFASGPFQIVTDGTNSAYALPDDFYKLLGVDLVTGPGQSRTLRPFNFSERNVYGQVRYRLQGNNLLLSPKPGSSLHLNLWYIPQPPNLTDDNTSTLTGVLAQYSEFIVLDSAIKCLVKEESDPSALLQSKAEIMKRIQDSATPRDAGRAYTVSDRTSGVDFFDLW